MTRKSIGKSLRFEVFKRDSFKCQYCGAEAPAVVLHVDHIKAVANGGTNDLTNLITSCMPCNLGKSDVALDDHVAVVKARAQMDELQERREQLELMMQWQEGLRDIKTEAVTRIADYWHQAAPGYTCNAVGKSKLQSLLRRYSIEEICEGMDTAAAAYLVFVEDGSVTEESWERAFGTIPGICRVKKLSKSDPDIQRLFYIRGILRRRLRYFRDVRALELLKAVRAANVPMDEIDAMARTVRNWTQFTAWCEDAIAERGPADETERLPERMSGDDL